jgi:hypothetical protein
MDASLRSAQRLLGQWVPHVRGTDGVSPTLETLPPAAESPRLALVSIVEDGVRAGRQVPGVPVAAFGGFLDGTQTSRVLVHDRGVPVVHGLAAAVIRERRERRLVTWRRDVQRHGALYAPRTLVPELWDRIVGSGLEVIDTSAPLGSDDAGVSPDGAHPAALTERARRFVELRRERLERQLAEAWCASERMPLCIDGSIGGSERVATARTSVGVVKRHHTIYGGAEIIALLAALEAGERSAVFRLAPARRTPVLSWYLRLHGAAGRDPTWGLVRIEIAVGDIEEIPRRADEVSRWVLAERAPLSLPDPRWAETAYGVRDCKEMLRAIM